MAFLWMRKFSGICAFFINKLVDCKDFYRLNQAFKDSNYNYLEAKYPFHLLNILIIHLEQFLREAPYLFYIIVKLLTVCEFIHRKLRGNGTAHLMM